MATEQTSKAWKAIQCVGWLGCGLGVVIGYLALQAPLDASGDMPEVAHWRLCASVLLAFASIGVVLFGKLGAWWCHG